MSFEKAVMAILRGQGQNTLQEKSRKTLKSLPGNVNGLKLVYRLGEDICLCADSFHCGVFGAKQSGYKIVESRGSTNFVVDVRRGTPYFSIGGKFAREAFA